MDKEDILDSIQKEKTVLKWWEEKRIYYNLILIGTEVFLLLFYIEGTKRFGLFEAITWSLLYTFAANILYSAGWGVEIFLRYYKIGLKTMEKLKPVFFLLGTLFSIYLTWISFKMALTPPYRSIINHLLN